MTTLRTKRIAHDKLRNAARRALDLLKAMEADCAIRMPFNGFEDTKAELEQALGV